MTNAKDQYSLGILTISDAGSKGEREDTSGDTIVEIMTDLGFRLALRDIVSDEHDVIFLDFWLQMISPNGKRS